MLTNPLLIAGRLVGTALTLAGLVNPAGNLRGTATMSGPRVGTGDPWAGDGELVNVFRLGTDVVLQGGAGLVYTETLGAGNAPTRTFGMTTNDGVIPIILGPVWHFELQPLELKAGEQIKVTGKRAMVGGVERITACEIKLNDRTVTLWEGQWPVWAGH